MLIYVALVLIACFIIRRVYRRKLRVGDVHQKHVLITGCDTGFGRCLAARLDRKGVPVFAGCLTQEGAESLRAETSSVLHTLRMDVTSTESIDRAVRYVEDHLPHNHELWGVVNNAGTVGPGGPVEFHSRSDYDAIFSLNFYAVAEMTNAFLPLLKRSRGRIVNISSMAGFTAWPCNPVYTASKFAVYGWTEALRREKAEFGITVSMLCPGFFRTGLASVTRMVAEKAAQWEALPEHIREEYGEDFRQQNQDRETLKAIVNKFANPDLDLVAWAYEDALFSLYPRDRYLCGADARLMAVLQCLPSWVTDLFLKATTPKSPCPVGQKCKAKAG